MAEIVLSCIFVTFPIFHLFWIHELLFASCRERGISGFVVTHSACTLTEQRTECVHLIISRVCTQNVLIFWWAWGVFRRHAADVLVDSTCLTVFVSSTIFAADGISHVATLGFLDHSLICLRMTYSSFCGEALSAVQYPIISFCVLAHRYNRAWRVRLGWRPGKY